MSARRARAKYRPTIAALVFALACPDAATRVVYNLESGAKKIRRLGLPSLTVDHTPRSEPEGCPRGYTLQLNEAAELLVSSQDFIDGRSSSSYITTYHLRHVTGPRTSRIHEEAGEHTSLELSSDGDDIIVTAVR